MNMATAVKEGLLYYQTTKKDIVVGQYLKHLGHWEISIYDESGNIDNYEAVNMLQVKKWLEAWQAEESNKVKMRWIL